MSMIQIRNVPEALHRRLKARAAMAGLSLSDLLLREVAVVADTPSVEELRARLAALTPVAADLSAAEAVRAEREAR
jgi:plasmid stability protein